MQERIGQFANGWRHCGGEKECLPGGREQPDNFFNVGNKSHIQHPVCFINDQNFGVVQQESAPFKQVEQAARCCNQHIHATVEHVFLVGHAFATNQQRMVELEVLAILYKVFGNLKSQLACGFQNERTRHTGTCTGIAQDFQHGQGKGGCFACASLGNPQNIARHKHGRNSLCLNGGGVFIPHLINGLQNGFGEFQICKGNGGLFFHSGRGRSACLCGGRCLLLRLCFGSRCFGGLSARSRCILFG